MTTAELAQREIPKTPTALSSEEAAKLLAVLNGWELAGKEIARTFAFKDFHETMAFVNAVADVANDANHHPDMEVGYNRARIRFSTHDVGGLSESDFICAARVEGKR